MAAYGMEEDEHGATLFVKHHLAEIEAAYWEQHFQSASPDPAQVLDLLILKSNDFEDDEEEEEEGDMFDFTLPGDVTNYVICVSFDEDGEVEGIAMESLLIERYRFSIRNADLPNAFLDQSLQEIFTTVRILHTPSHFLIGDSGDNQECRVSLW